MDSAKHSRIVNLIWGIADDVLRDLYVRGKYRDVILPFTVLRRLDSVLEPTKDAVVRTKATLDKAGIVNQDAALRQAAGQDFYNTSSFTMKALSSITNAARLKLDFEVYLDGFSPNVQEIIDNFELRNQIPKLSKADAIGTLLSKFLDPNLDLSPTGLDNHGMGTVFEELVRRFNEDNNEEAGEHWTPRDAVKLMTRLMFEPIAEKIPSGSYLLYDGAMGTGGMLTVAEETLKELTVERGKQVKTHLFGQEINAETYAIAKADLILKGEGEAADNADRVQRLITEEIPRKVAEDTAYQNAKKNNDPANARVEHDRALARVMLSLVADDTELFKQFSDNDSFKKWLSDAVFRSTYGESA